MHNKNTFFLISGTHEQRPGARIVSHLCLSAQIIIKDVLLHDSGAAAVPLIWEPRRVMFVHNFSDMGIHRKSVHVMQPDCTRFSPFQRYICSGNPVRTPAVRLPTSQPAPLHPGTYNKIHRTCPPRPDVSLRSVHKASQYTS